jgi:DMSO/TMAO reductase YedYZ molybdopterin-dependent catalytic subunit
MSKMSIRFGLLMMLLCISTLPLFAQININGNVSNPRSITEAELLKLPQKTVKIREADGKESIFEGPELSEALKTAGVIFGEELKQDKLRLYLLVQSSDKLSAVFSLPELDSTYTDDLVIIALKYNSAPLPGGDGPFRIINSGEKRRSRWVKKLTTLTIFDSPTEIKKADQKKN